MDAIGNLISGGATGGYGDMANEIRNAMQAQQQQEQGAEGAVNPYYQAGTGALGAEQNYLGQMANPQDYLNKIMGGWKMSPGAQFEMDQGTQAANRGAAASGMLGSGAEQKALMQFGQGVASRDMQNYLNNILGIGNTYLGGESGLANMGMRGAEDIGRYKMDLGRMLGEDYGGIGRSQLGQSTGLWGGINDLFGL